VIARLSYARLPRPLVDELAAAGLDPVEVYGHVVAAFEEDLPGGADDVTSAAMPEMGRAVADVVSRETGVVAGLAVAEVALRYALGEDVETLERVPDGTRVGPGDTVLTVAGPVAGVLTGERTALNFASHLSGVATATSRWVDALAGSRTRVLDTRLVRAANPDLRIEVEVTDLDQLVAVIEAGCTEVLLDNMDDATLTRAVELTAGRATLEASGGITLERAQRIAATGVDFVSVGALTHSVTVFDLGLDFRED
jgi:nicotinate-nucleotide pyrophosphorylase (carboxylating)